MVCLKSRVELLYIAAIIILSVVVLALLFSYGSAASDCKAHYEGELERVLYICGEPRAVFDVQLNDEILLVND